MCHGGSSDIRDGGGEEGGKNGNRETLENATSISQVRDDKNLKWTSVMFAPGCIPPL